MGFYQHQNRQLQLMFIDIKATLKRDLTKWGNQLQQRSDAGKASAEARKNKSNETQTK